MTQPRITASYEAEPWEVTRFAGPTQTMPGVYLEVTFDRGDHQAALRLLEAACEDVRRQIADAAEGSGECAD